MKSLPCLSFWLATLTAAPAVVVTTFDEPALPAAILLDVPNAALGSISFDAVNDELDFNAAGNTDMWGARNNAAIAWTAAPSVAAGGVWTVETEVRMNNVAQNNQVAGITFYGGPDGARPDITFGLDNWDPAARAVRLQGLGDNIPNTAVTTTASTVTLRVVVQEGGATDTCNFFFKVNAGDPWTQIPGVAVNYPTSFPNTRVGLTYKTGAAKAGVAFTYFNVTDTTNQPPAITSDPASLSAIQGGAARFTVTATGAVSYQWRRGGSNVPSGGTSATYVMDPVLAGDNGASFDCVVTNGNGSATSNPAILTVVNPPVGSGYFSSAVQAEPSLFAYFPVDGSAAPAVTNVKKPAYSGTLGGTAAHDSTAARTIGVRSVNSNGGGWVGVTKDPEWDFSDGNGTIEMFVYHTATAAYNPSLIAVRNDFGGGTRYSFHADSAGTKIWYFNGTGAPTWTLPANSIGRLMHLVFVINNGQCILYHNGVSLGALTHALGGGLNLPAEIGSAGPSAQESFPGNIDEVALYADPLPASAVAAHYQAWLTATAGAAPVIATQPAAQTINEGDSASFSVALNDAAGASYRWQKNGIDIPGATAASYTLNPATLADHNAQFRCVIYNPYGGALTTNALLTVNDTNPPQLLSATAPVSSSQVILTFNEPVDISLATFGIAGATVTSAVAGPLPGMVTLAVTGLAPGQGYSVTAGNVRDLTGNVLTTANAGFTAAPLPVPAPIDLLRPAAEPAGPATRRGPFVFSEIHYHPRDRADLKNLEFIEIHNSQPWAEDLSGFRLAGEVNFTFPAGTTIAAGGRLVVAAVPADVMSAYGISGVLGPWTGALNNSGGEVRLRDIANGVVFEVDYDAGMPWPAAADGTGHSLVLARPSYGMKDPGAWDISFNLDGSPGAAEPVSADPYRTVVINELSATAAAPGDFIELYNYSSAAVDVSGCSLSDDRDLAKFVIAPATIIPPGGVLWFNQTQLGFGMKAGGDTVYFRAPGSGGAAGRVLDAVRFGPQRPGTSFGRHPDGAPAFAVLNQDTAGSPNAAPDDKSAVISEILYHPPPGSAQLPFVEIANTSGALLDLAGWRLRGGVSYDFPAGTTLADGASLAVTNFSGSLNAGTGERLRLEQPILNVDGAVTETIHPVIDEVTYRTGGRWGRWSDGGGSSLEKRDLWADGRQASSWADSDESGESGWVTIEHTGVLDNRSGAAAPIDRLHVMLLGEGECLVDNVEVIPAGGGNLVNNGGFESGLSGWILSGTHDASALENTGFSGSGSLHIRAAGRGDLAGNRITAPLASALAENSTATIRAKVKWLRGHPEILLRINSGVLEATGNILPNSVSPGTPGAVNSRATANAGPAISRVTHRPVLPQTGQAATVYARISDGNGIGFATLRYRIDPSATLTNVVMSYRGAGLFSADIPAQPAGTLVAYSITAYDAPGAVTLFPEDAPVRECLIRWGEPTPAGNLGVYRLWMTQATNTAWTTRMKNSNTPLDVTFVYGNSRVIYNASAQYSGSPFHTGGFSGPTGANCDYSCNAPVDDPFLGETDFILAGPGTFGDDTSFIREQTAWWIARKIGLPSLHRRFCRVFVNGTQRQTVFEDTQQPGGEFIDEYWPGDNDGHLHKAQDWIEFADNGVTFQTDIRAFLGKRTTTGGAHKIASYRYQWSARSVEDSANDWVDFTTLVDAFNTGSSGTDPAFLNAVDPLVDQDSWARALAIQRICGNWDTWGWRFGKNMYIYKPTQGPWAMTAWDIDFSFGLVGELATYSLFADTQDPLCDKFRANPKFRRAYWCAFREAVDGPMVPATANARIDAWVAGLAANGITSNAGQVSTVKTYVSDRRNYILGQLNAAYGSTPFALTGSSTLTDADGILTLAGTAPPGVKTFRVNGIDLMPAWSSETAWSLPLTLYAQNNALTVEGIDLRGNVVGSFPVTVTVTTPPAPPPVFINEWMADNSATLADPADGQFEDWFELYNAGPVAVNLGGFFLTDNPVINDLYQIPANTIIPAGGYLLVWADDEPLQNGVTPNQIHAGFKLGAGGEFIGLRTSDGTLVDSATFGAQLQDFTEGRFPNGGSIHGSPLTIPTPAAANAVTNFLSVATDAAGLHFTVQTTAGLTYQLETSSELTSWAAAGAAQTATGPTLNLLDPAPSVNRRFYRVMTNR